MHKAKCKKKTAFQSVQVKSVFLYGNPNKGKQDVLSRMERQFTDQVNRDIALLLDTNSRFAMQLINNDKKDSALRQFEKANRLEFCPSAAFCQNAFDVAVTKLSLRLNDIRQDMYRRHQTIFTQSKVLFALALQSARKEVMVQAMMDIANARKTKKEFYLDTAKQLGSMSNAEFSSEIFSFADEYAMASLLFKVPTIRREQVVLDSRMMKLEKSTDTKCSHVLSFSNPFDKGHRITIPINTSRNSIRRMAQYDTASTVFVSLNRHGKLRVQLSLSKEVSKPKVKAICGVDTGIKDCFYCSDGRSIGTMGSVISFYKKTVEPSFGELSSLRNKKRKILYYVRHHKNLNSEVKEYLLAKVDRLHHMTQVAKAPYRRKRHYYQMLNHEVSQSVKQYIAGLDRDTLTVLERLDIKEFNKGKRANGMFSVFARGLLQKKMMEQLNWHGYDFLEVEPDYSSQTCPVCFNIDSANRNGKDFTQKWRESPRL